MTKDAQTALRRIMEETSRYTRFVLICNYSSNIIEPIQSRTAIFRFKKIGQEEVAARLKKIAKAEEVKVADKVLQAIAAAVDGDLRQGINLLQAASAGGTEVTLERVNAATGLQREGEGGRDHPHRARRRLLRSAPEARRAHEGLRDPGVRLPALCQRGDSEGRRREDRPTRSRSWRSTTTGSRWGRTLRSS